MSIRKKLLRWIIYPFSFMILIGTTVSSIEAAVIDEIGRDFKPISGYVVREIKGNYIIDLDSSHGIVVGDLFAVIKHGEKLIHPVTRKIIGNLENLKGILKITRIKSGYSYARSLGKTMDIERGDPIRRYENLNTIFWDYTGKGRPFFKRLQSVLPDLKWQDYDAAQLSRPQQLKPSPENRSDLFFVLTSQGIEVRDSQFYVLHKYNSPESLLALKDGVVKSSRIPVSAFHATLSPDLKNPAKKNQKEVRYEASFENLNTIGKLPGILVMTDFIQEGKQMLMAGTDGALIKIFNVTEQLIPIATGNSPYPGQILGLKWWRPSRSGPLYLSVLIWSDNEALSTIFIFKKDKLIPFRKRISRILGAFDLDGDQRPETLLGQEFDKENFFGRRIKELRLVNDEIRYSNVSVELPKRFTVYGSCFADITGDGRVETIFIRSGILYVYTGKKRIYSSSKQMGGSLSFLTYDKDPYAKNIMTTSAVFEISPVAADLDGDGQFELLAVASEKSYLGTVGITPDIKKSWLSVVKFRNATFHMGILGSPLSSPIQGLTAADNRVLVVSPEVGTSVGKQGSSYIFDYSKTRQ